MLTYISLFSGAGVGCYGFQKENFTCIATCEISERRLQIQKINNKCEHESGYICSDMRLDGTKKKIFEQIAFYKGVGVKDVDLVVSTPPCQGMSVANHKKKNNEIERNSLVVESIHLVKEIRPKVFIFENVRAFLKSYCVDYNENINRIEEYIEKELSSIYNIHSEILNFKEYGIPSSRNRAVVIGTRKDIETMSPFDLFPNKKRTKNIKQSIGHLAPLKKMGQIDSNDIYHFFREYDTKMLPWIRNTKEGDTAFNNKKVGDRPHKVVNGEIIANKNKNGDKYKRNSWGEIAPCIHTRNDILASQSTIHPRDDRVFSVRELMIFMSIPTSFRWSAHSDKFLNSLSIEDKRKFIKKNDINIRQCIGEAVPTKILQGIAKKIKQKISITSFSKRDYEKIVCENGLKDASNLKRFLTENTTKFSFYDFVNIIELTNLDKLNKAGFYTKKSICYDLISELPNLSKKKEIRILEPSVGAGAFLPILIEKYKHNEKVIIDVFDIDSNAITFLKLMQKKLNVPTNITINIFNEDFLLKKFNQRYDLIIGNPPFGAIIKNHITLSKYKKMAINVENNNIFSFFLDKALLMSDNIAFICPKSFISSPSYGKLRSVISSKHIMKLSDYGEKAFNVKIETIGIVINNKGLPNGSIKINSLIDNTCRYEEQDYICSKAFPYWLLYRNKKFDLISKTLELGVFSVFRDRQISKKDTFKKGKVQVLKSRNIENGNIVLKDGYDRYVNEPEKFKVFEFMNKKNLFLTPNLTYKPRMCPLPQNVIVDGSVAILIPKNKKRINKKDVEYFASNEFKEFYRISQNYGTRSLNIDANSVYYFGLKKHEYRERN